MLGTGPRVAKATAMSTCSRELRGRVYHALSLLTALLGATLGTAQVPMPPDLGAWQSWVLHGHENHRCPWLVPGRAVDEERICAWPSALELQVDARGGRFNQRWEVSADSWLPLPGGTEDWPENVTLDGKPAAVVAHGGAPALRASIGAHAISGTFSWARRPELLSVPASVALIALTVDGARVPLPQRSSSGIVLGAQTVARQDNRIDVRVFRKLDDGLPAFLTTQIRLVVAGEARELRLPQLLPQGFVPTSVDGPLAARLDPDNTLRVQIRPGDFELTVVARGPSPVSEVRVSARPAPWPADEVWSFQAQDRLRVVAVEGVAAVDPVQANVPSGWLQLPAYRMSSTAVLRVSERSRGVSAADANKLRLHRTAWLDFSGAAYTIVDTITGEMRQGWRLQMSAPYALQSARAQSGDPLLVTAGLGAGSSGIEVRDSTIAVTAVSRLPRSGGALPATGWHERLTEVSGQLIVGPGYRLLAALGPDAAPQAWLERWRLLDIFAALLIATVAWRVLGLRIAVIALGAIALTHQESGSATWLWLNVLIALALLRAAPQGRLRQWAGAYRLIALALLLFAFVPFAISQARLALYPQLEALMPAEYGAPLAVSIQTQTGPELERKAVRPREIAERYSTTTAGMVASAPLRQSIVVTAARRAPGYEPGVAVQAGPGLPDWRYHVYDYSWNGPVETSATARFLVSPPWMTRLWRLLGVLLSILLLYELTRNDLSKLPQWLHRSRIGALGALLLAGSLGLGFAPPVHAASTPDPALLSELQARLLEPPQCAPDCADILAASASIATERLSVVLNVSAMDAVGVALPGADPNWSPDLVQVDGAAAGWVYRSARGIRYVRVAPGRHVVRLEGSVRGVDTLALTFPLAPHVVDVSAPGWDNAGITGRRLMSGALELARRRIAQEVNASAPRQEEFPAFVSVDRLFHLAHDWSIDTTLERIAPKSGAFTLTLPLLAQEAISTPGLEVTGNAVTVGLAVGQETLQFNSIIPISDSLELIAANDSTHSEHWRFDVGATWHVDFSGLPAVAPEGNSGVWIFEYYPRPGEHLKLAIHRPEGTAGGTVAFDRVQLATSVGKRSSDTTLELSYRSTQGGRQVLHLPPQAQVTAVLSDGAPIGLRPEKGELSLSALPGTHQWSVTWQAPSGAALVTRSPAVALSAPASNLQLTLRLPEDRWVLYAFGAGVGPTILYWGELLLFMVIAWLIGRSRLTPLATRDWLLLGLGLSTFSWLVFGLFVAFIAVFEWRARRTAPLDPGRFNLLQVGLAALGLAAVLAVIGAVPGGLLAHPDMRIAGSGAYGTLAWFIDQSHDELPRTGVLSVSLWWYKLAMLAWALWLSFALTRWIKWAWQVFARDGLWRHRVLITGSARRPEPPAAPP